ncbi:septal ring lytic transglycosylase RlpA family protein [Noviherbaspirillum sp.]|uniref:septal ring lytic transglycosylase RlpA family protein n=1 Tax=Noviherbaspirillum sp. TaxID=1926288 RepID=UPI002D4B3F2D|nr:septal ring lytic transglycosylase RlpA family protein [Noviherbaspirillum sp.]HZW23720.1 septal ring lytic transglycosylase RlpA family protein [Noviherbaspirillum sp.]
MSLPLRHRILHACQLLAAAVPLILAGCSSVPLPSPSTDSPARTTQAKPSSSLPALPPAGSGRGGYYKDDGPGDAPPEGLMDVPDAEPRIEPYSTRANRPYTVFGKSYTPVTDEKPFKQRGIGSWYGRKFHGQKTSSGEPYDMYKMTAAHPTLPIPSYARVTNLSNGKQVVVRINDRGPFHSGRIIDLSYTAALKLGYLGRGSSELEVERILHDDIGRMAKGPAEQAATPEVVAMPVNLGGPEAPRVLETQAASAPAVVASPPAVSGQGYYLQIGAYSQAANAEAARQRLEKIPGLSLRPMEVVEYGMYFRVYSGPFATRAEADAAARQLQEGGLGKAMIVQR